MAAVFYCYIVNDVIPQNPKILQINLNKKREKKERKKKKKETEQIALWDKTVLF